MKKKTLKKLKLSKSTISKIEMNQVKGGVSIAITFLCPSQIYAGEDVCISAAAKK